jgi:hypothetical protein
MRSVIDKGKYVDIPGILMIEVSRARSNPLMCRSFKDENVEVDWFTKVIR